MLRTVPGVVWDYSITQWAADMVWLKRLFFSCVRTREVMMLPCSSTGSSISLKKWSLPDPDNSWPCNLSKNKIALRTYKPKFTCSTGSSFINPRKMSGCSMAAIYFRAALLISHIHSNTNKMRKYVINNNMRGVPKAMTCLHDVLLHIWTALLV